MRLRPFSVAELSFISAMIAMDFGSGFVIKPLLGATGVMNVIRLDMILPMMMLLVTRLVVDRFGTLILYEGVWGLLASMALPASYGLPGLLKMIPAIAHGLTLDTLMSLFRNYHRLRLAVTGVVGGAVNTLLLMLVRIAFGMPWSKATKVFLGVNLATGALVHGIAVVLAILVWRGIGNSVWVKRIKSWKTETPNY